VFTGIVEAKRPVAAARAGEGSLHLEIDLGPFADGVRAGDSIAVRGCCLTVERLERGVASFHLMAETLGLTAFGALKSGSLVNIERSLRLGDRMGGHFVSGHVDGLGRVETVQLHPGQTDLTVRLPAGLADLTVPKGSIALDGVSLTIARLEDPLVTVSLIPHTLEVTTLGELRAGDPVHLEMDMIGKWVKRLLRGEEERGTSAPA
jgi:riboflavin synthase